MFSFSIELKISIVLLIQLLDRSKRGNRLFDGCTPTGIPIKKGIFIAFAMGFTIGITIALPIRSLDPSLFAQLILQGRNNQVQLTFNRVFTFDKRGGNSYNHAGVTWVWEI